MKKKEISLFAKMTKIRALEFLIENNFWQGAGMYEVIVEMFKYKGKIDAYYLLKLLKKAKNNPQTPIS